MEKLPEQPKRFPLQEDQRAKERIHATRDAIVAAKKIYPEIISGGLYGSLARGTSKGSTSDIDCMVFIDPTEATVFDDLTVNHGNGRITFKREGKEEVLVEMRSGVDWLEEEGGAHSNTTREFYFTYFFSRDDGDTAPYENVINQKILEKNPDLDNKRLFHVAPMPISHDLIAQSLHYLYITKTDQEEFKKQMARIPEEKEYADNPDVQYAFALPVQIEQIFFLELGTGLAPYRAQVLETLESMGDIGEEIWHEIVTRLEKWEQSKTGNTAGSVYYPRDLTAARKTYLDRYDN